MGPGGLRGLQILLPGARTVRGGFDSHASPPPSTRRLRLGTLAALGVAAALALPVGAPQAAARTAPEDGPPPARVAFQSMALPGWGQIENGSWLKAAGFFGAYAGMFAWGVSLNQEKQDARGALNRALGTADEAFYRSEVDRLANDRNAKFWFAGLATVLSMADAYVDASLKNFDERINADVAWWSETERAPVLGLALRVPLPGGGGR